MDNIKIAVDAMGGDNAPSEIIKGAEKDMAKKGLLSFYGGV